MKYLMILMVVFGLIHGCNNYDSRRGGDYYHPEDQNPFSPTSDITYQSTDSTFVTIVVYNVKGELVDTLVNEIKPPGIYSVNIDNDSLESGLYFYKVITADTTITKKMILLK